MSRFDPRLGGFTVRPARNYFQPSRTDSGLRPPAEPPAEDDGVSPVSTSQSPSTGGITETTAFDHGPGQMRLGEADATNNNNAVAPDYSHEFLENVIANGDLRQVATLSDSVLKSASTSQKARLIARAVGQRFNIWHRFGFTKLANEPDLLPLLKRVYSTVDTVDQLDRVTAHVGNRRLRKFFSRGKHRVLASSIVQRLRDHVTPGDWSSFGNFLERLTKTKAHSTTAATLLLDEQVLPSLLTDIEKATESIDVQLYIMSNDKISGRVINALIKKAKQGVPVRVILDGFGSTSKNAGYKQMFKLMREGGIDLKTKNPNLLRDHLDHRKIWLFDGKVGYTGGANLGHHYHGDWRDQQTRMSGGTVAQLEDLFVGAWKRVGGQEGKFDGTIRADDLKDDGLRAHVVHHHGGGIDENIKTAYLRATETAKESIYIANPYFADKDIVEALCAAAERGVNVELVVPRALDSKILLDAARMHYQPLKDSGVVVREYLGKMAHHKVAVFDDEVATLGSSNLDTRSLENNDEANVFFSDPDFAKDVREQFFDLHRADAPEISDANAVKPKTQVYRYVLKQAMTLL